MSEKVSVRQDLALMIDEEGPIQESRERDCGGRKRVSFESLFERLPESFVVIDREGLVQAANGAFLDLVQVGAEAAVIDRKLTRWLSSPGVDANVIMLLIRKHGDLRRFQTRIDGELGQSVMVEISAVGDGAAQPLHFGLLFRETKSAMTPRPLDMTHDSFIEAFDDRTLEAIVRTSTEVVERKAILRALERCGDNRTAAARQLGLSRQSLHSKLKKYGLERK